jgi:acyl-coenzyme A thioesterase PaaI-like protein
MPRPARTGSTRLHNRRMRQLETNPFGEGQPCFGCAPDHPIGFRLRFAVDGDEVVTRFTPGERYQGPPGIMHGGLVSTLADEVGAWTVLGLLDRFGFTASLQMKLTRPVRIGVELEGRGRVARASSRVAHVNVRLVQSDVECVAATLAFAIMDRAGAEALLGQSLPDAWRRFCRD